MSSDVGPVHEAQKETLLKIMAFSGKWLEVEHIVLSGVTQTVGGKHCRFSSVVLGSRM